MKKCLECNKEKPLSEYHKDKSRKDGFRERCKDCRCKLPKVVSKKCLACGDSFSVSGNAKAQIYCGSDCQKVYTKYGIDEYQHEDLLIRSDYKCAICGKDETNTDSRTGKVYELSIDHCHETNKVRGILCSACNAGLGYFKDNISSLKKAIEYLNNAQINSIPSKKGVLKECPSFNASTVLDFHA